MPSFRIRFPVSSSPGHFQSTPRGLARRPTQQYVRECIARSRLVPWMLFMAVLQIPPRARARALLCPCCTLDLLGSLAQPRGAHTDVQPWVTLLSLIPWKPHVQTGGAWHGRCFLCDLCNPGCACRIDPAQLRPPPLSSFRPIRDARVRERSPETGEPRVLYKYVCADCMLFTR